MALTHCVFELGFGFRTASRWETANLLHANMLDGVRYMLVWHPVLIILVQGVNGILHLR